MTNNTLNDLINHTDEIGGNVIFTVFMSNEQSRAIGSTIIQGWGSGHGYPFIVSRLCHQVASLTVWLGGGSRLGTIKGPE